MSLQPLVDYVVPDSMAWVAKAAFPKGTLCLQIYDHLGTLFQDQNFATFDNGGFTDRPFAFFITAEIEFPSLKGAFSGLALRKGT